MYNCKRKIKYWNERARIIVSPLSANLTRQSATHERLKSLIFTINTIKLCSGFPSIAYTDVVYGILKSGNTIQATSSRSEIRIAFLFVPFLIPHRVGNVSRSACTFTCHQIFIAGENFFLFVGKIHLIYWVGYCQTVKTTMVWSRELLLQPSTSA